MRSFCTLILLVTTALAQYTCVDDYTQGSFADKFDFFTGSDPTNGYVNYVDYATASSAGLYNQSSENVYIGVDHTSTATGSGRNSVRIASKQSYQHGLIVLDLAHMPGGACGTWPAFWLLSTTAEWPNGGEVDIIEGVNTQNYNNMAVHTNAGCTISNTGMLSQVVTSNCDIKAADQGTNQGCSIKSNNTDTYGAGFNANGGGVYATEWTSNGISIWYFPRSSIPADITSGNPSPSGWGTPLGRFAGACDWDEKVVNQQIIFDITFCGDWAGATFSSDSTCSSQATTCQSYVQNNPKAFADTYWSVNGLKVYQRQGAVATSSASTIGSTSTSAISTSTSSFISTTQTTTSAQIIPTVVTTFVTLTTIPTSTTSTSSATTSSIATVTTTTTTTAVTTTSSATSSFTTSSTTSTISTTSSTVYTTTSATTQTTLLTLTTSSYTTSVMTPVPTTTSTRTILTTISLITTTYTTPYLPSSNSSWQPWPTPISASAPLVSPATASAWNNPAPSTFSTITRPWGGAPSGNWGPGGNWGPPDGSGPGGWSGPGGFSGPPKA